MNEQQTFHTLPDKRALARMINGLGFPKVKYIFLFPFSTSSPTLYVRFEGGIKSHAPIVVRGAMQNKIPIATLGVSGLRAEIQTLNQIEGLGIHCSLPLHDGQIFNVSAEKDATGISNSDERFDFFLTNFIHGIAVDRKIRMLAPKNRHYYFNRIAGIYAKMHSIESDTFGVMGEDGNPREKISDLDTYISHLFDRKYESLMVMGERSLAGKVRGFFREFGRSHIGKLRIGGERPKFVVYDSSAGNMLISGRKIGLIDVATAGYFTPLMEFCCPIVCMGDLLLEKFGNRLVFDEFIDSYEAQGGSLSPREILAEALLLIMLNHSVSCMLYFAEHRNPEKRQKKDQFRKSSMVLSEMRNPTFEKIIRASS